MSEQVNGHLDVPHSLITVLAEWAEVILDHE
jgi:hypothetical protein